MKTPRIDFHCGPPGVANCLGRNSRSWSSLRDSTGVRRSRLMFPSLSPCLDPVLISLAFAANSLLVEFTGPCSNLRRIAERLPGKRGRTRWIKYLIGEQSHPVIHEEPSQSITLNGQTPIPAAEWLRPSGDEPSFFSSSRVARDFRSFPDPGLLPSSAWDFCEVDFTMTVLFLLASRGLWFRRRLGKSMDRDCLRNFVVALDSRLSQKVSARKGVEAVQSCSARANRSLS